SAGRSDAVDGRLHAVGISVSSVQRVLRRPRRLHRQGRTSMMTARLGAAAVLLLLAAHAAAAATLDRVRAQGVFRIGYRTDAVPFAYKNPRGEPTGYAVDLCRAIATEVKRQLQLANLKIDYVEVSAENSFQAVKDGAVDILCGPTTQTLKRRAIVDFS